MHAVSTGSGGGGGGGGKDAVSEGASSTASTTVLVVSAWFSSCTVAVVRLLLLRVDGLFGVVLDLTSSLRKYKAPDLLVLITRSPLSLTDMTISNPSWSVSISNAMLHFSKSYIERRSVHVMLILLFWLFVI
jgi:hypothetical protein